MWGQTRLKISGAKLNLAAREKAIRGWLIVLGVVADYEGVYDYQGIGKVLGFQT